MASVRRSAREKFPENKGLGAPERTTRRGDKLFITLLGPFELRSDAGSLRLPKKAQALVAFLALHRTRPVPREQLATLLWGNSATDQARQSLRQCLAVLRNVLGHEPSELLIADTAAVQLAESDRLAIDATEFEAVCQSATLESLELANTLYHDEFLAGLQIPVEPFNDWVSLERQRFSSLRFDLLQRLAEARANVGDKENAITAARQLTVLDPLREEGHRLLMQFLASVGNRSAALKQYERCLQVLHNELGIAPDSETSRLAEAIRTGSATRREPISANQSSGYAPPADQQAGRRESPAPDADHPMPSPARLPLPNKPSIVVLPFANLSGDPAQDYFVDGLVEDITVALGREKWLFVIASPSAFAFKDRATDPREVGAKLGVRYVLRGSVRREGSRVRIVVQLTDAASGAHIWSDRFEDEVDNVFAMHDRLMTQVAAMIAPALRSTEIERAERKPTGSLTAYDLYLRALPQFRTGLADNQKALQLLRQAIELDPSYGAAYGFAARCYQFQKLMGWVSPSDPVLNEGIPFAHRAAELGKNDSEALWMAGLALVQLSGEIDHGLALIERSLALNPNSANAWTASCFVRSYLGDSERAIDHFSRAQRLNPLDLTHHVHWNAVGMAYFTARRYEEADSAADKALNARPTYPPGLRLKVATCGLLGRIAEGRAYVERLLAVHPECSVSWLLDFWGPIMRRTPHALAKFAEGARLAGLPEESRKS